MVLGGPDSLEQVADNTACMADFQPLSAEEHAIIDRAVNIIQEQSAVPRTGCRYGETGCPKHIALPDYFALDDSARRATSPRFSCRFAE